MTAAATLFFVVRTDIDATSGMQRCFGAFDTEDDAARLVVQIQNSLRGEFAIYEGAPVAPAGDAQVPA
jgi:hypothetical protein